MITYTVTVSDEDTRWYLGGKLHRQDGPAITTANGTKMWCLHGKFYREDDPAVEFASGDKWWCIHDDFHRVDGPAIERVSGKHDWYLNGEKLTEAEFNARMNPPKELTVAEIEKLLGYSVKVVK